MAIRKYTTESQFGEIDIKGIYVKDINRETNKRYNY
jgi:hypothetical protein